MHDPIDLRKKINSSYMGEQRNKGTKSDMCGLRITGRSR